MRLLMMTQTVDMDDPTLGFTHEWVNTIAKQVSHLHVITPVSGRHQLADNVTLHAFRSPNEPDHPLKRHLFFHRNLINLNFKYQFDGIFVHMIQKWVLMCWPYAKVRRIPISLWYTHSAVSRTLQAAHKLVNHIFTANLESYPLPDAHVNPMGHGIYTNLFKPKERKERNGRFQIIMPGRITATKQPHLLVEALHALPTEQKNNIQCHIMGNVSSEADRAYHNQLCKQIDAKGLSATITVTAGVPYSDMLSYYQQADLVVNLSRTNSLDKTVLEGMACGVPVLTSNPACHAFLHPIDLQLILAHGDINALIQQLDYFINMTPKKKQQVGQALRQEVIQHHNLDQLMARMIPMMINTA